MPGTYTDRQKQTRQEVRQLDIPHGNSSTAIPSCPVSRPSRLTCGAARGKAAAGSRAGRYPKRRLTQPTRLTPITPSNAAPGAGIGARTHPSPPLSQPGHCAGSDAPAAIWSQTTAPRPQGPPPGAPQSFVPSPALPSPSVVMVSHEVCLGSPEWSNPNW